jgi:FMN phosphatase YigB (HAD superfamily)
MSPILSDVDISVPSLLPHLSDRLLEHFSSRKGYEIHEDSSRVLSIIRKLKELDGPGSRTIVGVISNSDPRVRSILTSLGLYLAPENLDPITSSKPTSKGAHDIDFVVLSYNVGFEKPAAEVFQAAEAMTSSLLPPNERKDPISKLYIGDELEKDGVGALKADWESILVDRDGKYDRDFHANEYVARLSSQLPKCRPRIQLVSTLWPMTLTNLWPWEASLLNEYSNSG